MKAEGLTACAECGMSCESGEYHPYAVCLMFKGCHDSEKVRANLPALARQRSPILERAARLLGAEAMHYRNSDTMGGKLRYQQLLEAANAIYTELGQPESIMPLPGAPS